MIDARRMAPAGGKGVVPLDGRPSEALHVEHAERMASKAAAILEPEEASG